MMSPRIAERWLHWYLLSLALVLCLMRFAYLAGRFSQSLALDD